MIPHQATPYLFPYTTLFRSMTPCGLERSRCTTTLASKRWRGANRRGRSSGWTYTRLDKNPATGGERPHPRSEEHTSELQSQSNLVCRLLLEKKNNTI